MPDITLSMTTNALNTIVDCFTDEFGWTADSGTTRGEFTKQKVIEYMKVTCAGNRRRRAADEAGRAAEEAADAEITIT